MNNKDDIKVTVCSDLDHDNVLAEIVINGKFIGLVTDEPGKEMSFEIPEGQLSTQSVPLDLFEKALSIAKERLKLMDES